MSDQFRKLLLAIGFVLLAGFGLGQGQDQPAKKFATGRVEPKNIHQLRAASEERYGHLLRSLPKATAAKWDCRDLGIVPPVVDQSSCGSCWDFSGCSICTSAAIKAGIGKNDGSLRLSEQYVLDCGRNGGCNGDDNTTVLAMCKSAGLPNASDYGSYTAREGQCRQVDKAKFVKLNDWGFCTPGNQDGIASTQDIKNAMVQYGPIGSAIAADDAFMNVRPGQVFAGNNRSINHDIVLVGWDDSKGRSGAWLLRNSWGSSWCDGGYCWIEYGANSVGTEAVWCSVTSVLPPTPPTPPTPPVPPVPPGPTPPGPNPPTPSNVSLKLSKEQVDDVIRQSGAIVIRGDMTLTEVLAALEKARTVPCCGRE